MNNSSSGQKPGFPLENLCTIRHLGKNRDFPWGIYEPFVIPAKAGIQIFNGVLKKLDSGFRRNDELELFRVSLALVGAGSGRGELWLGAPEGAMLLPATLQGHRG